MIDSTPCTVSPHPLFPSLPPCKLFPHHFPLASGAFCCRGCPAPPVLSPLVHRVAHISSYHIPSFLHTLSTPPVSFKVSYSFFLLLVALRHCSWTYIFRQFYTLPLYSRLLLPFPLSCLPSNPHISYIHFLFHLFSFFLSLFFHLFFLVIFPSHPLRVVLVCPCAFLLSLAHAHVKTLSIIQTLVFVSGSVFAFAVSSGCRLVVVCLELFEAVQYCGGSAGDDVILFTFRFVLPPRAVLSSPLSKREVLRK